MTLRHGPCFFFDEGQPCFSASLMIFAEFHPDFVKQIFSNLSTLGFLDDMVNVNCCPTKLWIALTFNFSQTWKASDLDLLNELLTLIAPRPSLGWPRFLCTWYSLTFLALVCQFASKCNSFV